MLKLTLVTPEKKLLTDTDVEEVFVPGYMGELNILPGHAPLVSSMGAGVFKYKKPNEEKLYPLAVAWGYCEVTPKGEVIVLAEMAEHPDELILEDVKKARLAAEQGLVDSGKTLEELEAEEQKLKEAYVREQVASLDQNAH